MDKRKLIPLGILVIALVIYPYIQSKKTLQYVALSGKTMGPIVYNLKYADNKGMNYQKEVDSILVAFNQSMSTYIPDSEISQLNKSDTLTFQSEYFFPVLAASKKIFDATKGAFDPTIGPIVNAWGFGPETRQEIDSLKIDSLLTLVGFEKVRFNQKAVGKLTGAYIDFSAVAKGYAVDVLAQYLEGRGVDNYMVEIGGEVRSKGLNPDGQNWRIGIENPQGDELDRRLHATVKLKDMAMATSGNYRNFYEQDGKKYAHTINPKTGYPVEHSLLSTSVFAPTCMTADAFATAFMVMGLEKSLTMVNQLDSLDAYFIYADQNGVLKSLATAGIDSLISK
ncbi:MAG: FAD:protein FMN transferase [Cyclobacteriaceae bacterium]